MQEKVSSSRMDGRFPCQASEDFVFDYGQYEILVMGNFLCSAPTMVSTMDFSAKHVEDGVVDSPPEKNPCLVVLCSPSPLHSTDVCTLWKSPTSSDKRTQRKLYGDANYTTLEAEPQIPDELNKKNVELPNIPLAHPRKYVLNIERYLKRKLIGPSRSHSSSSMWDSWERRSLQAQRQEHIRQEGSYDKGSYSRGPEILKAMEKLKSISHR